MKKLARCAPIEAPTLLASARGNLRSEKSRKTFDEALDRVAKVIEAPSREAVPWTRFDLDMMNLVAEKLVAYRYGKKKTKRLAATTVNQTLAHVRALLRVAFVKGAISAQQYEGARMAKGATGSTITKGRALSDKELRRLLERCAQLRHPKGALLRAVILVGIGTGLRVAELCYDPTTDRGLTVNCVRNEEELRVTGKGGKEKACVVDAATRRAVDEWLAVRRQLRWRHDSLFGAPKRGGYLRPHRLGRLLARLCEEAGVELVTPHDLRRTFCTRLFEANVGLEQVRLLMSHVDPKTTMKYDKRAHSLLVAVRRKVVIFSPEAHA